MGAPCLRTRWLLRRHGAAREASSSVLPQLPPLNTLQDSPPCTPIVAFALSLPLDGCPPGTGALPAHLRIPSALLSAWHMPEAR